MSDQTCLFLTGLKTLKCVNKPKERSINPISRPTDQRLRGKNYSFACVCKRPSAPTQRSIWPHPPPCVRWAQRQTEGQARQRTMWAHSHCFGRCVCWCPVCVDRLSLPCRTSAISVSRHTDGRRAMRTSNRSHIDMATLTHGERPRDGDRQTDRQTGTDRQTPARTSVTPNTRPSFDTYV